jgi:WD40 repeat protein
MTFLTRSIVSLPVTRYLALYLITGLLVSCDADKGKEIKSWLHEDTGSYGAAISDDGKLLLTGSISGFGRVWDVDAGDVLYSVQHQDDNDGGIIAADFSSDNRFLVTIEQQSIARWSMADGRLLGYWLWPDLRDVAISANGRFALIGMKKNQAIYFDMQAGKMVYVFPHHEKITSVALSKDGRFALTGSDDWHASLWSLTDGKHIWAQNMEYKISRVELSDDGRLAMANAYDGQTKVFSTHKPAEVISMLDTKSGGMTVVSADFSDDGSILATGRAARGIDIWDVDTGKSIKNWNPGTKEWVQPDSATILDLNISADKSTLLSESSAGIGQLWSLN